MKTDLRKVAGLLAVSFALVAACTQPPVSDPGNNPPPPPSTTSQPPPDTTTPPPPPTEEPPPPPNPNEKAGALRPLPAPTNCTTTVAGSAAANAISNAKAGDRICVTGDIGKVSIKRGGSENNPVSVLGDGNTTAGSVRVDADWVLISGINVVKPNPAPGIQLRGNHITVIDSTVSEPSGGDGDAMRFFGSFIDIVHNTMAKTNNKNGHADCAQNFSTDSSTPETHDVNFSWNRCEQIANICLISEGPDSSAGDGSGKGETYNIRFTHNYCQAKSSQGIWLDDVQNWTVSDNTFDGGVDHAVGADNKSTGGTMLNNVLNDIDCEIGLSKDSQQGYNGPKSTCAP